MGLLVLVTNLELRSPVSTFFLLPAFKRLWNHLRRHSAEMWNTAVPPVRSSDKNFLYFEKKKSLKLLPLRVFTPLSLIFISILGLI